jgi:DNA-binding response OmpR family regulator
VTDTSLTALSVLVVEDNRDGADSTADLLQLYGHRVSVTLTGKAALELAADDSPDVVLLDIRLPDVSGWDVARRLREQAEGTGKRPLLIAVTGCGAEVDRRRSAAAGIDLHLVKPVEPGVLVGILDRFRRVLAPPEPAGQLEPALSGAGSLDTLAGLPARGME